MNASHRKAIVGFLASPLVGALTTYVFALGFDTRGKLSAAPLWVLLVLFPFALLIAYPLVWAVTVPTYVVLHRLRRLDPAPIVLIHVAAGVFVFGAAALKAGAGTQAVWWMAAGAVAGTASGVTFAACLGSVAIGTGPWTPSERLFAGFVAAPLAGALAWSLVAFPPLGLSPSGFPMLSWFVIPAYVLFGVVGIPGYLALRRGNRARPAWITLVFSWCGAALGAGVAWIERRAPDPPDYLVAGLVAGAAAGAVSSWLLGSQGASQGPARKAEAAVFGVLLAWLAGFGAGRLLADVLGGIDPPLLALEFISPRDMILLAGAVAGLAGLPTSVLLPRGAWWRVPALVGVCAAGGTLIAAAHTPAPSDLPGAWAWVLVGAVMGVAAGAALALVRQAPVIRSSPSGE